MEEVTESLYPQISYPQIQLLMDQVYRVPTDTTHVPPPEVTTAPLPTSRGPLSSAEAADFCLLPLPCLN